MSLTSKISVGHELLDEIERVSAKRERWKIYAADHESPQVSFAPGITLMTFAIDNAKKAIADNDAVLSIAALQALRDFSNDD